LEAGFLNNRYKSSSETSINVLPIVLEKTLPFSINKLAAEKIALCCKKDFLFINSNFYA
jgi:hypothetical protein